MLVPNFCPLPSLSGGLLSAASARESKRQCARMPNHVNTASRHCICPVSLLPSASISCKAELVVEPSSSVSLHILQAICILLLQKCPNHQRGVLHFVSSHMSCCSRCRLVQFRLRRCWLQWQAVHGCSTLPDHAGYAPDVSAGGC